MVRFAWSIIFLPLTALCADFSVTQWVQNAAAPVLNWFEEKELVTRFNTLPGEIQHLILFHYFNEREKIAAQNKEIIKKYRDKYITITQHGVNHGWYDIQEYYSFKNLGTECCHVIAFYGSPNGPYVSRIVSTQFCNVMEGSFAVAFIHTLENSKISSIDVMGDKGQIKAPCSINDINLAEKKPAKVYWLNKNTYDRHCAIKKDDTCIVQ